MIKIIEIQCSFYVRACMASSIKNDLFARVCMCTRWEEVKRIKNIDFTCLCECA